MTDTPCTDGQEIRTVDTHTAGQPTRIIWQGDELVSGTTFAEKRANFIGELDWLRRALMWEPRGHRDMFGAVIVSSDVADLGAIFLDHSGYARACIHGTIGVATAVANAGILPDLPNGDRLTVETAGGVLQVRLQRSPAGVLQSVSVTQPTARIVDQLEVTVDGQAVEVGVVGSDGWAILVPCDGSGIDLATRGTSDLVDVALKVRPEVIRRLRASAATNARVTASGLDGLERAPVVLFQSAGTAGHWRTFVVFGDGAVDRSPCGFGSANLAVFLAARAAEKSEQTITTHGVSGGAFSVSVAPDVSGQYQPTVTGSAFITGVHSFILDPADPFRTGFRIQ